MPYIYSVLILNHLAVNVLIENNCVIGTTLIKKTYFLICCSVFGRR